MGSDPMRLLGILALTMVVSSQALAQTCSTAGSSVYCDNGLSGQRLGNTTYWSNGATSTRQGNWTYNSDGTSSQRVGNSTYYSDGTTSHQPAAPGPNDPDAVDTAEESVAIRPRKTVAAQRALSRRPKLPRQL